MPKRKLTAAEKRAKAERRKKYKWIFINGKQVRVKRPPTIDGMSVDEFIEQNADPIWLQQNGMYDVLYARECEEPTYEKQKQDGEREELSEACEENGDYPF